MPKLPDHLPRNRLRTPCADKNDGLGWKHGLAVRWSGVTIGLRCNRPEVLPVMQAALPFDSVPSEERDCDLLMSVIQGGEAGKGRRNYHIVYHGWDRVARTFDWNEAENAFKEVLETQLAFRATEHTFLNCLQVELHGHSVMVCPGPNVLAQVLATFPESKRRVDLRQLQDCPQLVLVVDEPVGEVCDLSTPGQVALQLLRFAAPTWTQPQRVVSEIAGVAGGIQMFRIPGDQSRRQYEEFVSAHRRA